jgi:hypothetical protein
MIGVHQQPAPIPEPEGEPVNRTSSTAIWVARIATVVAAVALPVGMLSIWVAKDPAVKAAAITYLDRATATALNSSDQLGTIVRGLDLSCLGVDSQGLGGIADLISAFLGGKSALGNEVMSQIRPLIDASIHSAITNAVDGPLFEQAWVAANTEAHREVQAVLEDAAIQASPGQKIVIPLNRVVASFTKLLGCKNLIPASMAAGITPSFTLVNSDDLIGARNGYQVLEALRILAPIVFLIALAVALGLGRPWQLVAIRLSVGFVVAMAALFGALAFIKNSITSHGVENDVFDAVWGALTHGLVVSMIVIAVLSAAAGAGAWFLTYRGASDPDQQFSQPPLR